jgi:Domain of Unknown Function (DUF1206)
VASQRPNAHGGSGAGGQVRQAAGKAERAGQRFEDSPAFGVLVTTGLVSYGIVHLVVAWLALQLAWAKNDNPASQRGAFQELASTSVGKLLLWVVAVGMIVLALWQVFEAVWGHRDREEGRKRTIKRLGSAGKVVLYVGLGISAFGIAAGSSSSSGEGENTLTARLMGLSFGRILVGAIGVAIIVAGARLAYRGIKKKFLRDLSGSVGTGVVRLGQVGYIAKGIALAIIGVLFGLAAITYDPNKAGGLDTALRTLREQPFGPVLLSLVALGIAAFGLFCFVWSRNFKRT